MVRGAGFEPVTDSSQQFDNQSVERELEAAYAEIGTEIPDGDRRLLSRVVESLPYLSDGLKLAILAIVDASGERRQS